MIMKKFSLFLIFIVINLSANAVSYDKLNSFFNERTVQRYFKYAHPKAGAFEGVDVERITENRVTIKASFRPGLAASLIGGRPYTCTIYIDIDGMGRFSNVTYHCDSNARLSWPCFSYAADEIKNKCRNSRNNRAAINYMEDHFEKSLKAFNGCEAMCTLLNIAWFNYDY